MSDSDWFKVTVYRVGESANKAPSETYNAHSLTVSPDGHLDIKWDTGSHGFSVGAYESFEFTRVKVPLKVS
jgi:hypothetical protein